MGLDRELKTSWVVCQRNSTILNVTGCERVEQRCGRNNKTNFRCQQLTKTHVSTRNLFFDRQRKVESNQSISHVVYPHAAQKKWLS